MNRVRPTWDLFAQSFDILSREESVLVFPILSTASAVLLATTFFVSMGQAGTFDAIAFHRGGWAVPLYLFTWYYLNTLAIVFFNCALVACACLRLAGGNPTAADGLRVACSRIHRIAMWTLLASTLGMFLRLAGTRSTRAGRMVAGFTGAAWTTATYLIVPVILLEDLPIAESMDRSADLFRDTWGEQAAGGVAFDVVDLLLIAPGIWLSILVSAGWGLAPGALVAAVYLLLHTSMSTAAKGIFTAAQYRYATHGDIPYGFSAAALHG
jgi:hypothetical protein